MLLSWDIYEIRCDCAALHGVKMRGRIRKFSIDNQITALIENAADEENVVRFALIEGSDPAKLTDFVLKLVPEATVSKVLGEVHNPVLSKLKVNDESRYDV